MTATKERGKEPQARLHPIVMSVHQARPEEQQGQKKKDKANGDQPFASALEEEQQRGQNKYPIESRFFSGPYGHVVQNGQSKHVEADKIGRTILVVLEYCDQAHREDCNEGHVHKEFNLVPLEVINDSENKNGGDSKGSEKTDQLTSSRSSHAVRVFHFGAPVGNACKKNACLLRFLRHKY